MTIGGCGASKARGHSLRLLRALLARDAVAHVARALGPAAIAVMPLKGVLLQHTVDARVGQRAMRDVDLLVPSHRFAEAAARLEATGHRCIERSRYGHEISLVSPQGAVIDLHRHLFASRFRMPTHEVMGRAHADRDTFGAPVLILSPYDLYAHLVGKIVTDHADERQPWRLRDLGRVADRFDLDPSATALHLVRCGMRRAARYSLPLSATSTDGSFEREVLRRLPPDVVGRTLARGALRIVRHTARGSLAGAAAVRLLEHSVPRGVRALVRAVRARARPG